MAKTMVTLVCPTCQKSFEYQIYNNPKRIYCSRICKDTDLNKRKQVFEKFLQDSIEKHGTKYNYSKIALENYNSRKKVEIICPIHGSFFQLPNQHARGANCIQCAIHEKAKKALLTQEEFVNRAIEIHGEKYDYSLAVYKDYKTHIQIICPMHGSFWQSPSQHIWHQAGCEPCSKHVRISKGEKAWLNSLNVPEDDDHRQVYLTIMGKVMVVDGYVAATNTVYEYFGDYWHGNPNVFNSEDFNSKCNTTFGSLYQTTQDRITSLKENGFNVILIWESEWQSVRG